MIGERIRRARLAKGMSLEKLAVEAGAISKQAIHKYEMDQAIPSSDVVLRLAKALEVKPEYFFRPLEVKLESVNFRRKARLPKKAQKAIEETAKDHLERYLLLEDVFSATDILRTSFQTLDVRIEDPRDAEKAALKLRNNWNLGLDPIENVTELLEERGIKVVEVENDSGFDGLSGLVDGKYAVIAIGREWPGERQRFTLAHELGHLALKISPDCPPKHREKCCHRFAAAFLVPEEVVFFELGRRRRQLDYQELLLLKEKYGLSMNAWVLRARDLGIISDSLFIEIYKDFGRRGWRTKELEELRPEKPARFQRLMLRALAENLISETKASDLLGVNVGNLRKTINQWTAKLAST